MLFSIADPFLICFCNSCYLLILLFLLLTEVMKVLGLCRNCSSYKMILIPPRGDSSIDSLFLLSVDCHMHLEQLRVPRSRRLSSYYLLCYLVAGNL